MLPPGNNEKTPVLSFDVKSRGAFFRPRQLQTTSEVKAVKMMTTDEAKKVIYSTKFVENQHIYGFAKRNAARAMIEVDTYIKNHTFMNNYIEKRYGNNGNGPTNMSGGKYGGGGHQNTNNNSNAGYYRGGSGSSNYSQQQQQQQNGGYRGGGGNGYFLHQNDRKYGMAQQHYNNR